MKNEIDVSGHDVVETMVKERRRRSEWEQGMSLGQVDAMLLPLSLALARLTARRYVEEAA